VLFCTVVVFICANENWKSRDYNIKGGKLKEKFGKGKKETNGEIQRKTGKKDDFFMGWERWEKFVECKKLK
jgi:hypothetical protein